MEIRLNGHPVFSKYIYIPASILKFRTILKSSCIGKFNDIAKKYNEIAVLTQPIILT